MTFFRFSTFAPMPDHSLFVSEPVHVKVDDLPSDVAQQIRDVQSRDPEFLRNVLLYGITYREVFEALSQGWRG
jgi:hypothetical protein